MASALFFGAARLNDWVAAVELRLGCGKVIGGKVIGGKDIEQDVAPAIEELLKDGVAAQKAQAVAADLEKRGPFTAGPQILDTCEQILRGC